MTDNLTKLCEDLRRCVTGPCNGCQYEKYIDKYEGCPKTDQILYDAADAIKQLQADNERLKNEVAELSACKDIADDANCRFAQELQRRKKERDAAVFDLNSLRKKSGWKCEACWYSDYYDRDVCAGCGYNNDNNWQWRGAQGEEA